MCILRFLPRLFHRVVDRIRERVGDRGGVSVTLFLGNIADGLRILFALARLLQGKSLILVRNVPIFTLFYCGWVI